MVRVGIRFLQQYIGSPLPNLGGIFQKKAMLSTSKVELA
jgi:hypothetical protein